MARRLRLAIITALLGSALALSACSTGTGTGTGDQAGGNGHGDHPADGGPVPAGMTHEADPTYPVGSEVTLNAGHTHGMQDATATIVAAYDTYTYAVDYTPTTGGEPVTDHKWVVHEELDQPGDQRLADGAEVTLLTDHMAGMKGATATIAFSTDETVYVVDYEADGMRMTNHKWVVESEIEPAR